MWRQRAITFFSCIKDALVTVLHPIASNTTVAKKLVDKVEQRNGQNISRMFFHIIILSVPHNV